ncbi:MAG: threonylcarbamoyl-AMP synthase [Eubacterium sp.]|jgi:L-threonylcarbamoyladenylate synthase|nr:threonylcarbamoyl-AMP synthase [Eubacterium sp.]
METKIYQITSQAAGSDIIKQAASVIRSGGLVAFPTETVYGLGADATNPKAAGKIYAAKGRPSDNPLIAHICSYGDLSDIAADIPPEAKMLADMFWPGPLTIILKKQSSIPYETTGGLDTIAVRMPAHPVALGLIRASGCPIAAPSANTSGRPSPTLASHVAEDLDGKIPLILDGGEVGIGIESTIVDLTENVPTILRPGYITEAMIKETVGQARTDPGILCADAAIRPKAPGMKYRHYAPKAELVIVDGEASAVIQKINTLVKQQQSQGRQVGVLGTDETRGAYQGAVFRSIGPRKDEEGIARHLYRVLREFDADHVDIIYSESFSTPGIGQAVKNRLLKAAAHQVLRV